MNERIKELQKQAWDYAMAVHDGHIVPPLDKEVWPIDKVLDEKFAELIVRECIDVFSKDLPDPTSPDYQLGSLPEVVNRVANVAEHFGVEE